jgi:hypothetical protein
MRLISENKDANREEIEALYIAKCEMVPKLVDEALRRSFDNDWKQFQKPAVARRPARTEEEIEAVKAEVAAAVERVKEIVLLEWIMPNGNAIGDCTGSDVLNEADVRKMWGK